MFSTSHHMLYSIFHFCSLLWLQYYKNVFSFLSLSHFIVKLLSSLYFYSHTHYIIICCGNFLPTHSHTMKYIKRKLSRKKWNKKIVTIYSKYLFVFKIFISHRFFCFSCEAAFESYAIIMKKKLFDFYMRFLIYYTTIKIHYNCNGKIVGFLFNTEVFI